MELMLTSEQALLKESAGKLMERAGGVKRTRKLRWQSGGFDRAAHREMAAQGWLSILVPAGHDGLGLGIQELALVLEQAGRALAPEPLGACAVSAWAVAQGDEAARAALLEGLAGGERVIVPALDGGRSGARRGVRSVTAILDARGMTLEGSADLVPHAAHADGFLVEAASADGAVLAHVARGDAGVSIAASETVDGRDHGRVSLSGVRAAHVIAGPNRGAELIGRLYDIALVASAAELLGVMGAAHDMTVEYLKSRVQFGKPIGSFQALQHRAVNDYAQIESVRALLYQVCLQGEPVSPAMASALKAFASGTGLATTKSAIQMHGAIGFTDEHDIGLFLKRAMWLSAYLGNEAHHRKRYAGLRE